MIHSTADVSSKAKIGKNVSAWNQAQIREDAVIGDNCILSKNVYVDKGVIIGKNVKIQNNVSIYYGATIEDGVFIGPHVCFINDKNPRAINKDGSLKEQAAIGKSKDWDVAKTTVKYGASIGANSTILAVKIGEFALVGAGSVVTQDVPDFGLVFGNPAVLRGFVCYCGRKLEKAKESGKNVEMKCKTCKDTIKIEKRVFQQIK